LLKAEVTRLKESLTRGHPFGDEQWTAQRMKKVDVVRREKEVGFQRMRVQSGR
jgi:hypothetical protein